MYIILILAVTPLSGQILLKNNQKEPVMVALAHFKASEKSWTTRGWYTVNPGAVLTAFPVVNPGDTVGYWAMTTLSEQIFEGNRRLLVHNDEQFNIRRADEEVTRNRYPASEWRKFRLVLLPGTVNKGTIPLDK